MASEEMFVVTRRFAVGELITLYVLDLSPKGGGTYYFTNNVFEDRMPVKFDGHTFMPMPVHMENIDVDSQGAPSTPTFSIATSGGPVNALIQANRDLKGAYVWRYKTFAEFLDEMPDPANPGEFIPNPGADGNALLGVELYVIDRKNGADNVFAEFATKAPTDQEGVELPLRIVRKRWCDAHYRVPDELEPDGFFYFEPEEGGCPYNGTSYFDVNNQPTTAENDRCSKQMTGCLCRFGKTVALPFTGFPGIRSSQEA